MPRVHARLVYLDSDIRTLWFNQGLWPLAYALKANARLKHDSSGNGNRAGLQHKLF